jgi:4-amino-4-deoxy-L-arabinose transferase-like glycosyltransferase
LLRPTTVGSLDRSPQQVRRRHAEFRRSGAGLLAILVLAVGVYFVTASSPALMDDDVDATHALVARTMLQKDDYVVMYMNGVRYLVRAPLHFWLIAASYQLFGENEFTTRLPSALAVLGLVLVIYQFGCAFLSRRAGLYGALVIATSPGVFIFTRPVISEPIYALEFVTGFYLFLRAWTGTLHPRIGYWGAAGMFGLAVLTRGLIGVLFPLAVLVIFVSTTNGWHRWRELKLVSSALVFLAIAAPWHVLAELRAPGFLWAYFVNDHLRRALGTRWPPDYSAVPLWIWLSAHIIWLFPWSFFAPLAMRRFWSTQWRAQCAQQPSQALLLLWIWAAVVLVFFSIETGSRMEYYSFGAWPAIALLLSHSLVSAEREKHPWLQRMQNALSATALALALLLGYFVWKSLSVPSVDDISDLLKAHDSGYYRFALAHAFDLTEQSFASLRTPAVLAALSLAAMAVATQILRRLGRAAAVTAAMALGMIGFLLAAKLAFNKFEPLLSSRALALELNKSLRQDDQIAVYGDFTAAASVAFYTRRRLWLYDAPYSELEYGAKFLDAPKIFINDRDFSALWHGRTRMFLIVPRGQQPSATAHLPATSAWFVAKAGGKALYANQPVAMP